MIKGDILGDDFVLVCMYMFDLLFDVVGMGLMGCVNEFGDVMNLIVKEGCGVLVLLCDVYMKFEIGDEVSF